MRQGPQRGAHHRRSQTTTDRLELAELLHGVGAGLGVALPQERLDELVEQSRLPIGRNTPPAEMTSVDAGREERLGLPGDVERVLVEPDQPAGRLGGQHAVGDQLFELVVRDTAQGAEMVRVEQFAGRESGC